MGGSISTPSAASSTLRSGCDDGRGVHQSFDDKATSTALAGTTDEPPPTMTRPLSFDEKIWQKFKKEPLVPIGCVATAYFLGSGIKSFQNQDPRRAQKMMRFRVGAQFATLFMFMYYIGLDRINFEVAPQYQRARKASQEMEESGK